MEEKLLTGSDDDGGGLVVDGHGAVVGGDGEPAGHLVQPTIHVRPVGTVAPGTVVWVHGFRSLGIHFTWLEKRLQEDVRLVGAVYFTHTHTDTTENIKPNSTYQLLTLYQQADQFLGVRQKGVEEHLCEQWQVREGGWWDGVKMVATREKKQSYK